MISKITSKVRLLPDRFSNLDASQRTSVILVGALILIVILGVLGYAKIFAKPKPAGQLQEVDLPFTPDGPYELLYPRSDGHALVLDITRVGDYDAISYDLEYQSDGIDRGVHGDIKKLTDANKKSEYSQEILFGTCSQGFTTAGPHCVFDPDVQNGTLTLHIRKSDAAYRMITTWHMEQPDVDLGSLSSADDHFQYVTTAPRETLAQTGYTIINDLTGAPKLPSGKSIIGKVYALNIPQTVASLPAGNVTIQLANNPPSSSQIARYNPDNGNWELLQTKNASESASLEAPSSGEGIYAVLAPSQQK